MCVVFKVVTEHKLKPLLLRRMNVAICLNGTGLISADPMAIFNTRWVGQCVYVLSRIYVGFPFFLPITKICAIFITEIIFILVMFMSVYIVRL